MFCVLRFITFHDWYSDNWSSYKKRMEVFNIWLFTNFFQFIQIDDDASWVLYTVCRAIKKHLLEKGILCLIIICEQQTTVEVFSFAEIDSTCRQASVSDVLVRWVKSCSHNEFSNLSEIHFRPKINLTQPMRDKNVRCGTWLV